MANRSHRTDVVPPFSNAPNDEGSRVRERRDHAPSVPPAPTRKSDPNLSLDQRLVSKLAEAAALLARLDAPFLVEQPAELRALGAELGVRFATAAVAEIP